MAYSARVTTPGSEPFCGPLINGWCMYEGSGPRIGGVSGRGTIKQCVNVHSSLTVVVVECAGSVCES